MRPTLTAAALSCALSLLPAGGALAQGHGHEHSHKNAGAPYSGLQTRDIKSLSPEDIEELRRGGGWGLALPAELNGLPGPAHLLTLKEEIGLTAEQVEKKSRPSTRTCELRPLPRASG
ncbi:hypothetical protein QW131_29390 [Roseibium salinum]|nr:hypothetical protein [Roseibium salinum]